MADILDTNTSDKNDLPRGFHRLEVAEITRETDEASSITFHVPDHLLEIYSYTQGQYLTLMHEFDGERLRRPYSLWLAPDENKLRICSKKLPGGRMSGFLNDELKVGDQLAVMQPMGRFFQSLDIKTAKHYLMIAGGSGITPVMSNIRAILDGEPNSKVTLLYGNRTIAGIIFREQLADLKNRHMGRLKIIHVLSEEQSDLEIFNGLLDGEKLAELLGSVSSPKEIDHFMICGPGPMMDGAKQALNALGVLDDRITIESFGDAQPVHAGAVLGKTVGDTAIAATATIILGGVRSQINIPEGGKVLDAALAAKLDLPYACRGGVCCTCKAKLVEGEVAMDVNYGLEQEEVDRGFVLTCQSRAVSDKIVLDYDAI